MNPCQLPKKEKNKKQTQIRSSELFSISYKYFAVFLR